MDMDLDKLQEVKEGGLMTGRVVNEAPPQEVRLAPESNPAGTITGAPEVDTTTLPPVEPGQPVDPRDEVIKQLLERITALETKDATRDAEKIRAKTPELPKGYLKVFMGKIVIGWKSEKAELLYNPVNPNTVVGEILKARYFFIDGTDSGMVDQVSFTRTEERVFVRILEDHGPSVKIKFEQLETANADLREQFVMPADPIEIRKDFLNP